MIIFLCICFTLGVVLFWKFSIAFDISIQNTKSYIHIQSLFFHWNKKGEIVSSARKQENKKNQTTKSKKRKQWRNWILQHLQYNEINIEEQIGLVDPMITALAIPVLSTVTMIPLNYFKVNHLQFHFEIQPDYHQLCFLFHMKATASFRIFYLLTCIVKEKLHKINLKQ